MRKRFLSIMLTACLVMGLMPTLVFASEGGITSGGLCEHHTVHTTECGYLEAIEEHECTHVHDEICGYTEAQACTHVHTEECGENGESCIHEHDETCGYIEEQTCTHEHDETCGYIDASEGSPCAFVCDICTEIEDENTSENTIETPQENNLSDAVSAVQALIDEIPDTENITEDNYEDIADLLAEIDTLKEELTTEEIEIIDFTKYDIAVDKLMEFISQSVTEKPAVMASCICITKCTEKSGDGYTENNKECPACKSGIGNCTGRTLYINPNDGTSLVGSNQFQSAMAYPKDYYFEFSNDIKVVNFDGIEVPTVLPIKVPSEADVLIDLNGKTLNVQLTGTLFEVSGKLTIIDTVGTGKIINASNGAFHILKGGSVIMKGGTIENCVGSGAVTVESGGNFEMTGGTIKNNRIKAFGSEGHRNITIYGEGTVTIGGKDTKVIGCDIDGCQYSGYSISLIKQYGSGNTELIPSLYANYGEIKGGIYNEGKILYRGVNFGSGTKIEGHVDNFGTIDSGKGVNGARFHSTIINNGNIVSGWFHSTIENNGTISGGSFTDDATTTNNGTISGGNFQATITNNETGTISGGIFVTFTYDDTIYNSGAISGGESRLPTVNNGIISGGTFKKKVENVGVTSGGVGELSDSTEEIPDNGGIISGGTFLNYVENNGVISGGTFYGTVESSNGTIQDSAYVPVCFVTNTNKAINTVKVLRGQGVSSSDIPQFRPQKYGYDEFVGWLNGGDKFTGGGQFTADKNYIYAEFSNPITYAIGYDLQGGTAYNPVSYNTETEAFTLENPTKNGYDFAGWSGTGLIGSDNTTVTIEKGSTGDRVYTANYTEKSNFTINFNTNGGSSISPKQNVKWTDRVLDNVKTPSKSRYRFEGWVCNGITVNEYTTYSQLVFNDTTSSIILLAKWYSPYIGTSSGGGGGLVKKDFGTSSNKPPETPAVGKIDNTSIKTEATTEATNTAAENAAKADEKISLVNKAGTTVSGDFKEPAVLSISVYADGIKNINNLTLARFNQETGKLEVVGGTYNTETKTVSGYIDKAGNYFVVEKEGLTAMTLQVGNTDVQTNTNNIKLDAPPIISHNRTLVPLRFISESLGADVGWEDTTKKVTITLGEQTLTMQIGRELEGFGAAPIISNNRTMVPIRYVSEKLGANVLWVPSTQTISIVNTSKD